MRVILPNGIIKTIAGYNGDEIAAIEAELELPAGIFVDDSFTLLVRMQELEKLIQTELLQQLLEPGKEGYSGDVLFDFHKYPHIGPKKKKPSIKPFPKSFHDIVITSTTC